MLFKMFFENVIFSNKNSQEFLIFVLIYNILKVFYFHLEYRSLNHQFVIIQFILKYYLKIILNLKDKNFIVLFIIFFISNFLKLIYSFIYFNIKLSLNLRLKLASQINLLFEQFLFYFFMHNTFKK